MTKHITTINIERALATEDSNYLIDLLEEVIDNKELEEQFLEVFEELPKSLQMDIITMGLTKIIMKWVNPPTKFEPLKEGFLFSKN